MYTKGGDKGDTGLFGAKRVPKDSVRIEAYGTVDELNSCLGVAISFCEKPEIVTQLKSIQDLLFVAGGDLAAELPKGRTSERVPRIVSEDTQRLERQVDELQAKLPRLTNFILPGGSCTASQLHLARAICRRAERRVVALNRLEAINPELIPFLNRLSTYLFNLARYANVSEGIDDEVWKR